MKKIPLIWLLLLLSIVGSPTNAEGPNCPKLSPDSTLSREIFPEGFIFGTATAAYQVEGAANEDGRGKSMWDVYCKNHPEKCNEETGDDAVRFYHRYKEDIQLMKNLNTDAFRLSISWPRIFPYGKKAKGENKAGVQFYHDVLDELNKNGITPFVTIFHWDIPQFLEDEYGGFLNKKIVEDFRDYAEFLFKEYGGKVKNWVTINEPWVYAHAGYDIGKKAPGRCSEYAKGNGVKGDCLGGESGKEVFTVSHNLLLAHAEAVDAFRACKRWHHCEGKIGIAHSPAWFEPHALLDEKDPKRAHEHEDTKRALDFMFGWHHKPTVDGKYPQTMIDTVGERLPQFSEEQKKKLTNSADFVGVNYYTAKFAEKMSRDEGKPRWMQDSGFNWNNTNKDGYKIGSAPKTADKEMAVYSEGLKKLLNYIKDNYGNPEIMIMENGYGEVLADKANEVSVKDGTADTNRKIYLQRHLLSLYKAICDDKVNVKGYFVWSLLDNFEWQSGFKVRFGLYFVDFAEKLERHIKKSGEFYRDFLRRPSQISDPKSEL